MMMFRKHFRLGSRGHGDMVRAIGGTTGTAPRTRRKSRIASLSAFLAIGGFSLPLLASTTSAVAASPRSTPPIGTQLAELGSDTGWPVGTYDNALGALVAVSGTTLLVSTGVKVYVFTKSATGWKQTAVLK